uniref:Amino acid transporter transmembrane domain-containing protein n=1 Tax=Ananas comosus var. bracteatus TaxID=296719 RepID=A0A6V7QGG8_ANACO|nr:unnamed protein product [Ananas comosus var. bracteatus]
MEKGIVNDAEGGEHERQGTLWTATAHIAAAVVGSGNVFLCGLAQYINFMGTLVGYTITASTSMIAVKRANCFHRNGHGARCDASGSTFMVVFGLFQLVLSQLPSLENITWLSVVAVATSFGYSFISLGLCAGKWASHGDFRGTLAGTDNGSPGDKAFNVLLALGNIAFAYTFADILIEIQDTIKSPPPENKTMKKATFYGLVLTTIFYLLLGCIGYAAFVTMLRGTSSLALDSMSPFGLSTLVFAQPIFARFESYIAGRFPEAKFIHKTYYVKLPLTDFGSLSFTLSKLVLRTIFIMFTTLVAMLLPFFNAVLGLIGALGFWPLSVYFPVSMHMAQKKIKRGQPKWIMLQE